jgi:putative solute:sodium symporter small subunit
LTADLWKWYYRGPQYAGRHARLTATGSSFTLTVEAGMSKAKDYWKANLRLVAMCIAIWFLVSFVFGILLAEQLNSVRLGGYKLGFWFAQQGSMYIFVALIFFYAHRMNILDRKFGVRED